MSHPQTKTDFAVRAMEILSADHFVFEENQFSTRSTNRHLEKIPAALRIAIDGINSRIGNLTFGLGEIFAEDRLGFPIPLTQLAEVFGRHEVDLEVLEGVFSTLKNVAMFTCVRYTLGAPQLVTCVDASSMSLPDAILFSKTIDELNVTVVSKTAKRLFGFGKLSTYQGSYCSTLFVFFDNQNTHLIPHILDNCKGVHFWKKLYSLPYCIDVHARQVTTPKLFGVVPQQSALSSNRFESQLFVK